jgi:hypothetical protein
VSSEVEARARAMTVKLDTLKLAPQTERKTTAP